MHDSFIYSVPSHLCTCSVYLLVYVDSVYLLYVDIVYLLINVEVYLLIYV